MYYRFDDVNKWTMEIVHTLTIHYTCIAILKKILNTTAFLYEYNPTSNVESLMWPKYCPPISAYMHISKFIPCILTFEFPRISKLFPTKTFTLPHPIVDSLYITRVSPFKQTWLYSISKDAFTQVTDCLANWFWEVDF